MRLLASLLAAIVWCSPLAAQAQTSDQTRAAARKLGSEGVESYLAGDYVAAETRLDRAYKALRVPSLGLWSARALVKLGKLLEASERYLDVTRLDPKTGDAAVQRQAIADAASELEALTPRIPSFTLQVRGGEGELSVLLDGAEVPSSLIGASIPANPGAHVVEARRGERAAKKQFQLAEAQQLGVTLEFDAPPSSPPGPDAPRATTGAEVQIGDQAARRSFPALGWASLAVGGAGVAVGATTGLLALLQHGELAEHCPQNRCVAGKESEMNRYNTLRTISTVGFVAGAVGLAGAGVFLLTAPRKPTRTAHVSPTLGPGYVGVISVF